MGKWLYVFMKIHERQEEMETIAHEASGLAQLVFSEILPQASASLIPL